MLGQSNKKHSAQEDDAYILRVRSVGTKLVFGTVFVIFLLYTVILIYTFITVFINSLKGGLEYINDLNGKVINNMPDKVLWSNYIDALKGMTIPSSSGKNIYMYQMFGFSLMYALFYSVSAAVSSTLTAYAVAKYEFRGRSLLFAISIFTLTIPIVGNTASMLKFLNITGLYNTPLYIILANFGGFGFNFIVLHGVFKNISWSYAEAAMIDGAGHFYAFLRVMLPQAVPSIVTLIVVAFITAWNDYTTVLLYLPDYPTLSAGLYRIEQSITRGGNYPVYFAGVLLSVIPILILFSCCSKMIMKNLSMGGLKG